MSTTWRVVIECRHDGKLDYRNRTHRNSEDWVTLDEEAIGPAIAACLPEEVGPWQVIMSMVKEMQRRGKTEGIPIVLTQLVATWDEWVNASLWGAAAFDDCVRLSLTVTS